MNDLFKVLSVKHRRPRKAVPALAGHVWRSLGASRFPALTTRVDARPILSVGVKAGLRVVKMIEHVSELWLMRVKAIET